MQGTGYYLGEQAIRAGGLDKLFSPKKWAQGLAMMVGDDNDKDIKRDGEG